MSVECAQIMALMPRKTIYLLDVYLLAMFI
jgi:hypothetical protein